MCIEMNRDTSLRADETILFDGRPERSTSAKDDLVTNLLLAFFHFGACLYFGYGLWQAGRDGKAFLEGWPFAVMVLVVMAVIIGVMNWADTKSRPASSHHIAVTDQRVIRFSEDGKVQDNFDREDIGAIQREYHGGSVFLSLELPDGTKRLLDYLYKDALAEAGFNIQET